MTPAFSALLPVFFGLAVGYIAGKLRIVDNSHVDPLNTVVMKIALPITLFTVLASADRADVIAHGSVAAAILIVLVIVYAVVVGVQRWIRHTSDAEAVVLALTVAFPNTAAVALPIAEAVLGHTGELAVALSLAVGSLTLSPLTLVVLGRSTNSGRHPRRLSGQSPGTLGSDIIRALLNPLVVAPALGVTWSLLGLPFPQLLASTLDEIGGLTAGLALFVTGLVLSNQSLKPSANVILMTVIGNIARPLLALAIAKLIGLTHTMAAETVLLMAAPAGFFGVLLGLARGQRSKDAGGTLFYSTAVSIVTLPLTILLLPLL